VLQVLWTLFRTTPVRFSFNFKAVLVLTSVAVWFRLTLEEVFGISLKCLAALAIVAV